MRILLLLVLSFVLVGCSENTRTSYKHIDDGVRLLGKGNKSLALKSFDKAIAKSPRDRDVHLSVVQGLLQAELYRESVPYIRKAIALENRTKSDRTLDSNLYVYLANAYWKTDRFAEAEKAYETAIGLDEDNAMAYNDWAYMLAESNQHLDKALRMSRKAIALEPENGYFLDSIGWVYFQKGDARKALPYLRKAVSLVPLEVDIRLHYARALDAVGDKAALIEYHKVLELSPSNVQAKERIRTLRPKNTNQ